MDENTAAAAAIESPTAPPSELRLKPGVRIQLGARKGVVDQVRGTWKKPYDVRVRWDGEKYPVFVTYEILELDYAKGRLKVD